MRLVGKKALVTGGARGIGAAIAAALSVEGAEVWVADREFTEQAVSGEARENLNCIQCDLADRQAPAELAANTGPLDVLVNSAAIFSRGSILDCGDEDFAATLEVNTTAPFRLIRAYLPAMIQERRGSIINIASVASSLSALPERFAYGVSKAALIGITKSVARDTLKAGVRCNAICPGTIETETLRQTVASAPDPEAAREKYLRQQPNGRLGRPEEIAALAVHLAADESAFTTGAIIVADGGMTL